MRFRNIQSVTLYFHAVHAARPFYEGALDLPYGRSGGSMVSLYTKETALNLVAADDSTRDLVGRDSGLTLRMRGEGDMSVVAKRLQKEGHGDGTQADYFRGGKRAHVMDPARNRITLWEDPGDPDDLNMFDGPASVTVKVRNIQRALAFYTMTLELPMLDQPDRTTAVFFPGGTNLIIAESDSWSPAPPVSGETGVCLLVESPYAMIDTLKGRGVRFVEGPVEIEDAVLAQFEDPDRNRMTMLGKL